MMPRGALKTKEKAGASESGIDSVRVSGNRLPVIDLSSLGLILLALLLAVHVLQLVKSWLTGRAMDPQLPAAFQGVFDDEKYARSQAYTREQTRFSMLSGSVELLVLLSFWLAGGFEFLDQSLRGLGWSDLWTGVAFMSILAAGSYLLGLPFTLYETFSIEARYGFNRMNLATFIQDQLKTALLTVLLGLPFAALLLWIFLTVPNAWLWGWGLTTALSLLLTYLAPSLILPLFNKFEPMPDGELKEAIEAMADRCEFPLTEVSIVDGSKRSAKSNAYFTGFGKRKRIALYDTLVENHGVDELVGVLAHEIGHFKLKHLVQRLVVGILQTGAIFFLLGLFTQVENASTRALCEAFGLSQPSVWAGLVLFMIIFKPAGLILGVLANAWSRKHEFEADAYAAQAQGSPEPLIQALKKLSADNLSNLTPHPLAVVLDYSHPPMLKRLEALEAQARSGVSAATQAAG